VDLRQAFEAWRQRSGGDGWGLAWYLAAEFCERFYCSHGIVPHVIMREGLGYYGIQLDRLPCAVHGAPCHRNPTTIGRFTMAGNVENWITGSAGDHGLKTGDRAAKGEPVAPMLAEAVRHLGLSPYPEKSHIHCRHHRWGGSYVLLFRLAAFVALNHEHSARVWNHPYLLERECRPLDPAADQREHPGYFSICSDKGRKVLLRGDGQVLQPAGADSLWERYMRGESAGDLYRWTLTELALGEPQTGPMGIGIG